MKNIKKKGRGTIRTIYILLYSLLHTLTFIVAFSHNPFT